jgi:hypothetical protein
VAAAAGSRERARGIGVTGGSALEYSFEHGIDHCGRDGVAPLLVVGGPVSERDFIERDLGAIRGVLLTDRGLPRGIAWRDLDLALLFRRLGPQEYIDISFKGPVDLADLGDQPELRVLHIDCDNVKRPPGHVFARLEQAMLRWSDECSRKALPPTLRELRLLRPKMRDFGPIEHLRGLRRLHVDLARSLVSLEGLESLASLESLGLHDCPNLAAGALSSDVRTSLEVTVSGARKIPALDWLPRLRGARRIELAFEPKSLKLPRSLLQLKSVLELHDREIEWVD